jgi:hypothetical protein
MDPAEITVTCFRAGLCGDDVAEAGAAEVTSSKAAIRSQQWRSLMVINT